MAIKLEDFIPSGTNIFGARTPTYLEGLITPEQLKKAQQQSLFQGLLGTAVGYLAQPKNQNYGSPIPYLAKGYLQGMESAQTPFSNLEKDVLMKEKFAEISRERKQREALDKVLSSGGLYKTTTTGGEPTTPYKPVMQNGEAVAPSFTPQKYTPQTTTYDFDLSQINKLIESGNISAANTLMDLETKRRTLGLKNAGKLLSDDEAKLLGLRIDKNQKYFYNKEGKPELIQGQMLSDAELNSKKDQYKMVEDERGVFYIPKDPNSKLPILKATDGGAVPVSGYTKFKEYKPYVPEEGEMNVAYAALKGFGVSHDVASNAAVAVTDKARTLMKQVQKNTGQEITFAQAVEAITKSATESKAFESGFFSDFVSGKFPVNIPIEGAEGVDKNGQPIVYFQGEWRYLKGNN
jgi:hypothetical protein